MPSNIREYNITICASALRIEDAAAQVQGVLKEDIYFVPADTRMENGKPVGSSPKCVASCSKVPLPVHGKSIVAK